MQSTIPIVIVVAMERQTRALGYHNQLLWHIPADMKRFKALTTGHPIIMGRKTFASIVDIIGGPLPGRSNIVVTRNPDYQYEADNVQVVTSLEDALAVAKREEPSEIHIGGGAAIYHQALPLVTHIKATLVDNPQVKADTFFPEFTDQFTVEQEHPPADCNGLSYQWIDYVRTS